MSDLSWMRPKLAELANVTVCLPAGWRVGDGHTRMGGWAPDVFVEQAVMVLEAMRPDYRARILMFAPVAHPEWVVDITHKYSASNCGDAQTLPRAICLAIAAALGWTDASEGGEG